MTREATLLNAVRKPSCAVTPPVSELETPGELKGTSMISKSTNHQLMLS